MNDIRALARPEIANLKPYQPAHFAADAVRLNANEAPWRNRADATTRGLNRYPPVRPDALTALLAGRYGCPPERVLVTRGSSEAIDLLIRAFCRPYRDGIVICPPTFSMYEVYASIQGATTRRVPLTPGFDLDTGAILASWRPTDRILFLTSPNNPTANLLSREAIDALVEGLAGKAIVVIDAAYVEFSASPEQYRDYCDQPHVVVLRTLSKAHGLAGARCGVALGDPALTGLLAPIMPPYAMSTPCIEALTAALDASAGGRDQTRIRRLVAERDRLAGQLADSRAVAQIFPSDANFLLVRFHDAAAAVASALAAGILLRDVGSDPALAGCLRITIGDAPVNDRLLECIRSIGEGQ